MPDSRHYRRKPPAHPEIELTQTLRRLRLPKGDTKPASFDTDSQPRVMLLCRDGATRKWGPRWLREAGFALSQPADHRNAVLLAREERPDIVFVEAAVTDGSGAPVYKSLLDAADLDARIVVLASTTREYQTAVEAEPYDVARKPWEWRILARRARAAVDLSAAERRLSESEDARVKALDLADAARQRLRSRETFEPVTGLPNKSKFIDILARGMSAVDRDGNRLAVLVVGFNRFRLVVEAMGHEYADLVMAQVGDTLSRCLHEADRIDTDLPGLKAAAAASLDATRFAVMFSYSGDAAELQALQQRLLEELSQPVLVAGQTVYLSACIGIAEYPGDADDVDSLLQRADNAMRDAQSRGGGFKYYCTETDAAAARKLRIEHMLHEALDNGALKLAYQPINRVSNGKAIATEALLRWPQADGSYVSPELFVPIAEESGVMVRMGKFVLTEACRQLAAWRQRGIDLPHVSVNVSRVQLTSGDFVKQVRDTLRSSKLSPDSLELELSERGVLGGDTDILGQLHELKALGVRLAIDDFGTGAAAIAYLKELPVDVLKIDRSYISGITSAGKEAAIASAMIALGQSLGLYVVAEGVESEDQLATLRQLGCNAYQGFLVSRPADSDTITGLLETR